MDKQGVSDEFACTMKPQFALLASPHVDVWVLSHNSNSFTI